MILYRWEYLRGEINVILSLDFQGFAYESGDLQGRIFRLGMKFSSFMSAE
jgi:hypothetical protein